MTHGNVARALLLLLTLSTAAAAAKKENGNWTCQITTSSGTVVHNGKDINGKSREQAQMQCQMQLAFWAKVARKEARLYRAEIRLK